MAAAAGWSEAPSDLLWKIIQLLQFGDYIRFGAVCFSWHTVLSEKRLPRSQIPWLKLPDRGNNNMVEFFSLSENKSYYINIPVEISSGQCIGSTEGWLFFVDEASKFHMFAPLSGIHLHLPSINSIPKFARFTSNSAGEIMGCFHNFGHHGSTIIYLKREHLMRYVFSAKIIVSHMCTASSSGPGSLFVAIICSISQKLAVAKVGDETWNIIEMPPQTDFYYHFNDIIFYREQLYAVIRSGAVLACVPSTDTEHSTQLKFMEPPINNLPNGTYINDLVESSDGQLLQIWRWIEHCPDRRASRTTLVRAFVMKDLVDTKTWDELETIGDQALFLGHNQSIALSTNDFPELRRNCIYFTDNHSHLRIMDIGVYNMEDRTLTPYQPNKNLFRRPPVWFTPKHVAVPAKQHQ